MIPYVSFTVCASGSGAYTAAFDRVHDLSEMRDLRDVVNRQEVNLRNYSTYAAAFDSGHELRPLLLL